MAGDRLGSAEPRSGEKIHRKFTFRDFTLDLDRGILCRGQDEVPLRPKSFEVLSYLVEHHGELVTKTALIDAIWPDTAVGDNSLAQCLFDIRRALGDDSQEMIRTVARRGYIFTPSVTTPIVEFPRELSRLPAPQPVRLNRTILVAAISAAVILAATAAIFLPLRRSIQQDPPYEQITNFTDSAVSPALSPDGRMLAFLRSDQWWLSRDQIYVKLLPNGEPVRITNDDRQKYGLTFSPDGSRIAYTVAGQGWQTYSVSPLGGEPKLLLANAAGLTWLDGHRVLFSEIKTGVHMGVVTARENRSDYRPIYFPQDIRGMVHLSYPSPDRKWVLVVEMDPVWLPCRVVPMDGSSAGWQVGPRGKCTAAAWSPDGKWMYFGVEVDGSNHLWRQRFPKGEPEQITSGLTEEEGIAVAPDGSSLITSIGMRQSAVWIHDSSGERQVSSEGYAPTIFQAGLFGSHPRISRDGSSVYYLRRGPPEAAIELWRADLRSGKSESVVPGFSILEYDLSDDEKEVVFSTQPPGKVSQLWLVSLNRGSPPILISSSGETSPHFGPAGQILYRLSDGNTHYLAQMNRDGSGRAKAATDQIGNVQAISPDRRWVVAITPMPHDGFGSSMAVPLDGGAPRRLCVRACQTIRWDLAGKFLYIGVERPSRDSPGKTLVIPIPPGENVPMIPPSGISGIEDGAAIPGARVIDAWNIAPGPDPTFFAFVKTTVHRNLFRIPLRD